MYISPSNAVRIMLLRAGVNRSLPFRRYQLRHVCSGAYLCIDKPLAEPTIAAEPIDDDAPHHVVLAPSAGVMQASHTGAESHTVLGSH